jgi:hypothetical protein
VSLGNAATPSKFKLNLQKYLAGFDRMSCVVVVSVAVVEVGVAVAVLAVVTNELL